MTLTYKSDNGAVIQFGQMPPYILDFADLNGLGATFSEYKLLGYDGGYTPGGTYNKKAIPIRGAIVGASPQNLSALREKLANALNIHAEGWLHVDIDGIQRKIRARPVASPQIDQRVGLGQEFTAELAADWPYWLDTDEIIIPLGQMVPLFHFGFATPVLFGYAVSHAEILNPTSIEIPIRVEVMSESELITLSNATTGQYMSVDSPIGPNSKMTIDSYNASVLLQNLVTGQIADATNKLTAGSAFLTLVPGMNKISINDGVAGDSPLAYVYYYKHYLGV